MCVRVVDDTKSARVLLSTMHQSVVPSGATA
jgi:hypothetical protein